MSGQASVWMINAFGVVIAFPKLDGSDIRSDKNGWTENWIQRSWKYGGNGSLKNSNVYKSNAQDFNHFHDIPEETSWQNEVPKKVEQRHEKLIPKWFAKEQCRLWQTGLLGKIHRACGRQYWWKSSRGQSGILREPTGSCLRKKVIRSFYQLMTQTMPVLMTSVTKLTSVSLKLRAETFPRGCRKRYKHFWYEDLQNAVDKREAARKDLRLDKSDEDR